MPSPTHNMLKRQLRRHWGGEDAIPPEWRPFVEAVNAAYHEFDKDRGMLERSLDLSSQELIQANEELKDGVALLRESQERYRMAAAATGQIVYEYNIATGGIAWAGTIQELTGVTEEEFAGVDIRKWEALIHPEDRGAAIAQLDLAISQSAPYRVEYRFQKKDGSFIHIEDCGVFLPDAAGKAARMIGAMKDITERKQNEEALQKRVIALTQPLDDPAGIQFADLFNIEEIQRIQNTFAEATGVASVITTPDGIPITAPSHFCRLCRDVIRKTKKGLANCYRSDAVVGRQNPDGPIVQPCLSGGLWDAGASITVGGRHLANWLIGQVRNETQDESRMLHYAREIEADLEEFRMALAEVPVMSKERFEKVAQALFVLAKELSLKAYQNVQQARFITERHKAETDRLEMERRLLHAQKLESLGVLAGGIAHDFNNLLLAILGNLDLALEDLSPVSLSRPNLEQAIAAAKRATDLTRQMLAYSGRGQFITRNLDLSELVEENAHMLKAAIVKNVTLKMQVPHGLPSILADPGQIQQVVMNLITNASEAIGDTAGVVSISTGEQICDAPYLARSSLLEKPKPGRFVWLEVADTGCGMDAVTRQRLFEPFFTTKFTGRGLGMCAAMGIVQGHKGAIFVDSEPGHGATIRVLFPAVAAPAKPEPSANADAQGGGADVALRPALSGTILVVDDEDSLRLLAAKVVSRFGFRALTAANGEEALAIYREHAGEISCVLLDLTMPRMGGAETFEALRRINPAVKVLLCSGFQEAEATQRFAALGLAGFIQKPYRTQHLHDMLKRILGQTGEGDPA